MRLRFEATPGRWVGRIAALVFFALLVNIVARLTPAMPRAVLQGEDVFWLAPFSPDGLTLLTVEQVRELPPSPFPRRGSGRIQPVDYRIRVWDTETGRQRFAITRRAVRRTPFVVFSPDGRRFALSDLGEEPWTLRDSSTGEEQADPGHEPTPPNTIPITFSPAGQYLVLRDALNRADAGASYLLWNVRRKQVQAEFPRCRDPIRFTPDGGTFAIVRGGKGDGVEAVQLWRAEGEAGSATLIKEHKVAAADVTFSPGLDSFVSVEFPNGPEGAAEIRLRDMATGGVRATAAYPDPKAEYPSLTFSEDGKKLIHHRYHSGDVHWANREEWTTVWDVDSGLRNSNSFTGESVVSPDGCRYAVPDSAGAAIFETSTSCRRLVLQAMGCETLGSVRADGQEIFHPTSVAFSPDSKTVLVSGLAPSRPGTRPPEWLPDRLARVYPGASNQFVRLWRADSGQVVADFDSCRWGRFSPDGKSLATLQEDGSVRVWDVPPRKPTLALLGVSTVAWLVILVGVRIGKAWRTSRVARRLPTC